MGLKIVRHKRHKITRTARENLTITTAYDIRTYEDNREHCNHSDDADKPRNLSRPFVQHTDHANGKGRLNIYLPQRIYSFSRSIFSHISAT